MKRILILSSFILLVGLVKSQEQLIDSTASYVRKDMYQKQAIQYPAIREADVMWKRTVWRIVDLREKINQPLYFPVEKYGNRINLIQLIYESIEKGLISAYADPAGNGYEFKTKITMDEVKSQLGGGKTKIKVTDPVTGETTEKEIDKDLQFDMVRQYQIKEEWIFDKSMSTMKVRILGICPILEYFQTENDERIEDNVKRRKIFWLYFPELRKVLSNREIVNSKNEAESLTFDEFFYLRKFSSYVVRTGEREKQINEYTLGRESQLEADRIENELFNTEHDLWSW
jgi:gliding motility associated protien GldN